MKLIKNTFTILSEIIVLIISILWYSNTHDYEPLIVLIVSAVGLITSLISKFVIRPKIEVHNHKTDWGWYPKGYTRNNPPIIRVGIDQIDQFWELHWNFTLEIRNNSSQNAYSIEIEYKNIPQKTFIDGNFGKIEPLLANEKREFRISIIQNITGTHIDAKEYSQKNINELMKNTKIVLRYKDESGTIFRTEYDWLKDANVFKLGKTKL